jgi:hypothetical protein
VDRVERTAFGASFACLLHRLALLLVLAALPVLSSALATPETFYIWVIAFALPVSGVALVAGRAGHRGVPEGVATRRVGDITRFAGARDGSTDIRGWPFRH